MSRTWRPSPLVMRPSTNLRVAEAGLQRQDFVTTSAAHADGIGGDDVLEHHALRPGEFAAHRREIIAHRGRFELWRQRLRVSFREQIRQRAGQVTR